MLKRTFLVSLVLVVCSLLGTELWGFTPNRVPPRRVIEDFADEPLGRFPKSFRTYPFQREKARLVYQVKEESGNAYLNALDTQNLSLQIFREFGWNVEEHPTFSWRWRAQNLPAGGNERNVETNDSACGVYVVFGKYTGTAIKYVWSSTLPVGTVIEKKPGRFFIVSKERSSSKEWHRVTVNVLEDYRRLFKKDPNRAPSGFGILTDGNALQTTASCDYDDFVIARDPASIPLTE